MRRGVAIGIVVVFFIIVFVALGPFWILREGRQAVLIQFGRIVRVEQTAGLKLKTPVVDRVQEYSNKILSWDGAEQRIPTVENQFILVDATARWRIEDPERFYQRVTTLNEAQARLDQIIDSEVRKIIARNPLREAVRNSDIINEIDRMNVFATAGQGLGDEAAPEIVATFVETEYEAIEKGRTALSEEVLQEAEKLTPDLGIDLIDVIIRQIKYSDELTESVYRRMIADRQQIAQAFRSDGEGQKADWLGARSRELDTILSGARREAEVIKGDADALAAAIYANAYTRDPEFYTFWKAVETYRTLLPKFQKTLSTDAEFFDYLYDQQGSR